MTESLFADIPCHFKLYVSLGLLNTSFVTSLLRLWRVSYPRHPSHATDILGSINSQSNIYLEGQWLELRPFQKTYKTAKSKFVLLSESLLKKPKPLNTNCNNWNKWWAGRIILQREHLFSNKSFLWLQHCKSYSWLVCLHVVIVHESTESRLGVTRQVTKYGGLQQFHQKH